MRQAILYHLYSGQLFFSATFLFASASILDLAGTLDSRPQVRRFAGFLSLLSIPLALLSGTPLPILLAVPVLAGTITYVLIGFAGPRKGKRSIGIATVLLVVVAVAAEVPFHSSRVSLGRPVRLFLVGDSLSSGGFGEATNWPAILERTLAVPVTNLALPSDTTTMALINQVPQLPPTPSSREAVIIAVGGNDMLEGVTPDRFANALDQLLARAGADGKRSLIMLELPLLPGRWRFGATQRRLARKHEAHLVPKRLLAGVLVEPENTTDGIHLSQSGHHAMAQKMAVWFEVR